MLVVSVVVVVTGANSFAPKAASGGHTYKLVYYLAINLVITGALLVGVPMFASSIFETILEGGPPG